VLVLYRGACRVITFAWRDTAGVPRGSQRLQQKRHIKSLLFHSVYRTITVKGKGKGKAIPVQAWAGPKGSRRLRLPDLKTIST